MLRKKGHRDAINIACETYDALHNEHYTPYYRNVITDIILEGGGDANPEGHKRFEELCDKHMSPEEKDIWTTVKPGQ